MVIGINTKRFYCWLRAVLILAILLTLFVHAGSSQFILPRILMIYKVDLTSTPSTIYPTTVNPSSYSEIKVTVTNSSGSPISGATLNLTSTGGDIQNKLGTTRNDGTFTTRFSSSNSGSFLVNVTASTGGGNLSFLGFGSIQITVLNTNPTATFSVSPSNGDAPLTVTFDASGSTDIDGNITSYSWDFGDKATGSGKSVTHTYQNAGEFSPLLTVTDNLEASNTYTSKIIVRTAPTTIPTTPTQPTSQPTTLTPTQPPNPFDKDVILALISAFSTIVVAYLGYRSIKIKKK